MTQTLAVNASNDLHKGADGNLAVARGLQAVLQACASAAKAQLGEMVLAQNNGLPNFQTVWVGAPNFALFESYLLETMLAVNGVTGVSELSAKLTNGALTYSATISTIYGEGTLNG